MLVIPLVMIVPSLYQVMVVTVALRLLMTDTVHVRVTVVPRMIIVSLGSRTSKG